ncbi:MAG TPA: OsmC family protein [Bacteroidales bacterium]|nr:OsmC family protein [Bacteroidales bacterium]
MITSKIEYLGNLRTKNEHVQSGNKLITDAPTDNHGKGEAFSPTDLMSTSLVNCIFTIMGIKSDEAGFSIKGAKAEMEKIMAANPRRVAEIKINFDFSMLELNEQQKSLIESIPAISPVALSLHPDVKQTVNLQF